MRFTSVSLFGSCCCCVMLSLCGAWFNDDNILLVSLYRPWNQVMLVKNHVYFTLWDSWLPYRTHTKGVPCLSHKAGASLPKSCICALSHVYSGQGDQARQERSKQYPIECVFVSFCCIQKLHVFLCSVLCFRCWVLDRNFRFPALKHGRELSCGFVRVRF